jgi:5-methylcytosine-specific restriction protein B
MDITGNKVMNQKTVYSLPVSLADVVNIVKKHKTTSTPSASKKQNYVFIIDEINRGNISKIFGELITLIEESKRVGREEGMKTLLPYSMKPFGVPENVYIIGTMNTADRSIAAIDTALRRRFEFKEMLPDPEVVAKISVGNLSIKTMLEKMNRRIAVLYDREHTIGHAYFMPLAKDNSTEKLSEIFKNKVIPLLQEYFYEDYEKIRLVLADNQKKDERDQFILAKKINQGELFGSADIGLDDGFTYEINEDAFMNPEAYLQI